MTDKNLNSNPTDQQKAFEMEARQKSDGLIREFLLFMKHYRRWWLAPIIIAMLALGLLVFLGGTGAAPFIYTLF